MVKVLIDFAFIVTSREIRTGSVELDPPRISEIVDLYLNANLATTIPKDGSIEYIFPLEVTEIPVDINNKVCILVSRVKF